MKKAYTVTYCEWSSFGSILQSLGLQKTLSKLGVEGRILKDTNQPDNKYKSTPLKSINPKAILIWFFKHLIKNKTKKTYNDNLVFMQDNIKIEYAGSYENILSNPPKANFFIAGSDQIWHPDLCKPLFFLDFVRDKTPRISYAASMGKTTVSENKEPVFSKLIKNFDSISVRESDTAPIISSYCNKEKNVNIDPTFLLSAEEWRKYQSEYKIKEPYILVYSIYWNSSLNKQLKDLSKKTGLKIYSISSGLDKVYANKKLYDVNVAEFLWLIDNAQYVITSSFHGVAFSTIFNKHFSAVINPQLPSRIKSLTDLLSIPIIDISQLAEKSETFDYKTINKNIEYEKIKSIEYLSKELHIEE